MYICVWMVLEVRHLIYIAYCGWELMSYPIMYTEVSQLDNLARQKFCIEWRAVIVVSHLRMLL